MGERENEKMDLWAVQGPDDLVRTLIVNSDTASSHHRSLLSRNDSRRPVVWTRARVVPASVRLEV